MYAFFVTKLHISDYVDDKSNNDITEIRTAGIRIFNNESNKGDEDENISA